MSRILIIAVALLSWACAFPGPPVAPPPDPPDVTAEAVEVTVLAASIRVRHSAGLSSLESIPELTNAARRHALELARRGTLDHASEVDTLRTLEMRVRVAGVQAFRVVGENLASVLNPLIHPGEEVVQRWLRSEGHAANLLNPLYDRTGVGVVRAADGTWYVVQLYGAGIVGRPRSGS
jgi:uncharacterized protein YkwD